MKLSNRLTFCILSLILLLTFAAVPVMAHIDGETGETGHLAADAATHTPHPIVRSVTLLGNAADGYVKRGTFMLRFTFEAANKDNEVALPRIVTTGDSAALAAMFGNAAADARGGITGTLGNGVPTSWVVTDITKESDTSYTAEILATGTAGAFVLGIAQAGVVADTANDLPAIDPVYTKPDTDPDDPAAIDGDETNPAKVRIELDLTAPLFTNETTTSTTTATAPVVSPILPNRAPLDDKWEHPFSLTFYVRDDMSNIIDFTFEASPNKVSFSGEGGTGMKIATPSDGDSSATQYGVTVTPKRNVNISDGEEVTITIKLSDKADNEGMITTKVKLKAHTPTTVTPDPGETDEDPPTVTISDAAGTGTDADKVIFTFTFSEVLATTGTNAFTVDDINISNAPDLVASNLVTTDNMVYKLTVTPENEDFPVKVTLDPEAKIGDAAGNVMLASALKAATDTYTPPGVLGVEIDAPTEIEFGTLTFKFTFAEEPAQADDDGNLPAGAFTVNDIRVSNAEPLVASNLRRLLKDADDDTDEVEYELTVTPMDATQPVRVQLLARSVSNGETGTAQLIAGQVSATYTPTVDTPTLTNVVMIPANSYVVVVRDMDAASGIRGLAFRSDVMVREWGNMPDLERLFYTGTSGIILGGGGGGALIVSEAAAQTTNLAPGTVGISEIMWGIDANFLGNRNLSAYAGSQWIELHNLNTTDVQVMLSWKTGRAITNDNTITGNLARPVLDVVTNFFNYRPGVERWEVPGASGASVTGVNFVSMARKGTFNLTSQDGGQFNKRYTKTGGATKSPDGRSSGQWAASSSAYLSLRTTRTDGNDVLFEYIGTPGRANTSSAETQPHIKATRRNVPASPFIINEVANRLETSKDYEWIEIRNVTNDNQNLRNYLISIVTSNSSDAVFYQFPNSNLNVPGQGVLLLVASDPKDNPDHPLATGWNVDVNANDQQTGRNFGGLDISADSKHGRYKVAYSTASGGTMGMFGGDQMGLPDDGKFVLILRRPDTLEGHRSGADDGKGVAETGTKDLDKVVDIAGWDDNLAANSYPNAVSSTGLWPLHAMGGTFIHNRLDSGSAGAVHARRHVGTPDGRAGAGSHENKNEAGRSAFARNIGFTGIGYKRNVRRSNVLGGTPGYHAITKGKVDDLNAKVTISEIMLSQGNRGYPQWIELYNHSSTQAVQLDADDGWRLVVETENDPIGTINFKAKGSVKRILPKQTVLVVSAAAKSAGSDFLRASSVFPDTRTFNVFREVAKAFGMTKRNDPFLDTSAFHIKLIDGKGKVSDEIGNLDGNPRTSDQAMWSYPDGMTEDGKRTSLIRIYDDGVARPGLSIATSNVTPLGTKGNGKKQTPIDKTYSWVHAVDTDATELRFVRHTWYGIETDYGTPGVRAGQTLPVSLSFFRPTLHDGKVTIRWTTESELDNAGFNIYRSESRTGEFKQVNQNLIQGQGTTAERHTYSWVDTSAKPGVVYYYQIEDVSFAGERTQLAITKLKGLISATNKLTTTWGDLKEIH